MASGQRTPELAWSEGLLSMKYPRDRVPAGGAVRIRPILFCNLDTRHFGAFETSSAMKLRLRLIPTGKHPQGEWRAPRTLNREARSAFLFQRGAHRSQSPASAS